MAGWAVRRAVVALAAIALAGPAHAEEPGPDLLVPRPLPRLDAPPAPTPTPAAVTPVIVVYTVQVAAFRAPAAAQALAARLTGRGYPAVVTTVDLGPVQGVWHRVRVGRFVDRKAADDLAVTLASREGLAGQVVRDATP